MSGYVKVEWFLLALFFGVVGFLMPAVRSAPVIQKEPPRSLRLMACAGRDDSICPECVTLDRPQLMALCASSLSVPVDLPPEQESNLLHQ